MSDDWFLKNRLIEKDFVKKNSATIACAMCKHGNYTIENWYVYCFDCFKFSHFEQYNLTPTMSEEPKQTDTSAVTGCKEQTAQNEHVADSDSREVYEQIDNTEETPICMLSRGESENGLPGKKGGTKHGRRS